MKIRKLTNEEIKGACAFAVSIYNIAIRDSFRTQDCHRYFDEYMYTILVTVHTKV